MRGRTPLRELSARAAARPDRPHVLIVDEINRGNLPKIFGELYFLLEYRDQPLRLQYSSHEEFRLPPNLYVVGTMNTADRSIALLDAALRRRFAFIELSPDAEPVHGLLQRWLDRYGLDPEPQVLLETLNALLIEADGDRDLAIGPSYLMDRHGTAPDLETVWEYDILPLLAERFHGTGQGVAARFGLEAVREEATRAGGRRGSRSRASVTRLFEVPAWGVRPYELSAQETTELQRTGLVHVEIGPTSGVYMLRGLTSVGVAAGPGWELRVASHLDVHEVMFLLTYGGG